MIFNAWSEQNDPRPQHEQRFTETVAAVRELVIKHPELRGTPEWKRYTAVVEQALPAVIEHSLTPELAEELAQVAQALGADIPPTPPSQTI